MVDINLDFSELGRVLEEAEKRGRNAKDYAPLASEIMVGAVLEVFEKEGPGWPGLAESTLRQRRGGSDKILQDTANLVNSITPDSNGNVAEVFTNVPYAPFHITGTQNMPQRDFLAIDRVATLDEIATAILLDIDSP